jgi:hypothetical protein
MNIMPKQEAQAIVASREPQYLQSGSSVDVAAPHIGQLRVSAFITWTVSNGQELHRSASPRLEHFYVLDQAGLYTAACAILIHELNAVASKQFFFINISRGRRVRVITAPVRSR